MYGCPIWGLPSANRFLYVDNIPNTIPTSSVKQSLLNLNYKIGMLQGLEKKSLNCRPILIKPSTTDEKIKLLRDIELQKVYSNACLRNYDIKYNNLTYEKVHT